mgnify:CR=1 FL=1
MPPFDSGQHRADAEFYFGKLAAGIADDLASTVLLATDKKVLLSPPLYLLKIQ